ncbi:MAG: 2-C-methyl-D-erythritol 4-phosphate cytidylyltransferase [Elusimicrobiota bacterium]|nr:2-C-methyl-D-erythritol 4-phosphate cytidylyltransferase [Elusimicrobiota bacterium]
MEKASIIIAAGGKGTRMGRPKQMLSLNGKTVLERSIETFKKLSSAAEIIVVADTDTFKRINGKFKSLKHALPGQTRLQSVINGVAAANPKYKFVAIHDGARPLVKTEDIQNCLNAAIRNKAAVLAVAVKDTIKEVKNGFIVNTSDRTKLWAAQTPQCYETQTLKEALKKYGKLKNATDESQLVEKLGVKVAVVPSSYGNIKITTPEDLIMANALCKRKK